MAASMDSNEISEADRERLLALNTRHRRLLKMLVDDMGTLNGSPDDLFALDDMELIAQELAANNADMIRLLDELTARR
jgi:hypothetical protein